MKKTLIVLLLVALVMPCFSQNNIFDEPSEVKKFLTREKSNDIDTPIKITINADDATLPKFAAAIIESPGKFVSVTINQAKNSKLSNITFGSCKTLVSVTLPNGITSINQSAFMGCNKLESINIPNTVTSIGDYAFSNCISLRSITIPNSVTSIGKNAFSGCSDLATLTIGTGVTSIGDNAFNKCTSLKTVTVPNNVKEIGNNLFNGCSSITTATVGTGITKIGDGMFQNCSKLETVNIPNTLTEIGFWSFSGCSSLTKITIPRTVTKIGANAFNDCSSFTAITVPAAVTEIGENAFAKCNGLTNITFEGGPYIQKLASNEFNKVYWDGGRQSGIYTRPSARSTQWTNDKAPKFPSTFTGLWNKVNTNYKLNIEPSQMKLSGAGNRNPDWLLSVATGDTYTVVTKANPGFAATMTIKLVRGNLEMSDDVSGNDWNGTWTKQ